MNESDNESDNKYVVIQKQTFNMKDKTDTAITIFIYILRILTGIILFLVLRIIIKNIREKSEEKVINVIKETILIPIMLSLIIYSLNTTLPFKFSLLVN